MTPAAFDIFNSLPTPLLVLDRQGRVAMANAASEVFLNMSQAQMAGRGWESAFPKDGPVASLVAESRSRQQGIAAYDILVEFAGGRRLRVDVQTGIVPDSESWLTLSILPRTVATFVDRQIDQEGVVRTAEGVAAMLAHEIRNPLSGIRGAAQLLAHGLDADGRELTQLIISEVDRVRALIDRMEGFTDTRPLPLAPENIHSILGHVRRLAEKGFGAGVRFHERYDPSLPQILCDRDSLVQVFLNLVKNAVEASPPEGGITLQTGFRQGFRVRHPGSGQRISLPIEICVIDEGAGPPAHIAEHLFEPFISARAGGTGLGLALVARKIARHGGLVEYERCDDRTIFRILLPAARTT